MHLTQAGHTLHFYYDAQGKPSVVIYDGTAYGYLYNLQGDVVALVDGTGTKVVEYTYDAWGKPTGKTGTMASTLGTAQPFRYRGYVWDEETGLYYLRSRYYRAEWCRFLSADSLIAVWTPTAGSVYTYCHDNPVIFLDEEGNGIILACILIGAGIGLVAGLVIGDKKAIEEGYSVDDGWDYWKYVIGCGVVGTSVGALVGWGAGAIIAHFSVATAAQSIISGGGASFTTYEKLKQSMGSAGVGMEWHHIVEQCQVDRSGFSVRWIQNSNNVIRISSEVHRQVTSYYNSIHDFTDGMRFRDWPTSMSFVEQYKWGVRILKMFGVEIDGE